MLPKPCAAATAAGAAATCGSGPGRAGRARAAPARGRRAADGPALINAPATCGMCARAAARGRGRPARAIAPPPTRPRRVRQPIAGGGAGPARGERAARAPTRARRACPAVPRAPGVGVGSAIEEFSPGMSAATPAPRLALPCSAALGIARVKFANAPPGLFGSLLPPPTAAALSAPDGTVALSGRFSFSGREMHLLQKVYIAKQHFPELFIPKSPPGCWALVAGNTSRTIGGFVPRRDS